MTESSLPPETDISTSALEWSFLSVADVFPDQAPIPYSAQYNRFCDVSLPSSFSGLILKSTLDTEHQTQMESSLLSGSRGPSPPSF